MVLTTWVWYMIKGLMGNAQNSKSADTKHGKDEKDTSYDPVDGLVGVQCRPVGNTCFTAPFRLLSLPADLIQECACLLDVSSVVGLEGSCVGLRRAVAQSDYYTHTLLHMYELPGPVVDKVKHDRSLAQHMFKHIAAGSWVGHPVSVLGACLGATSTDRAEESALNTLHPSMCYHAMTQHPSATAQPPSQVLGIRAQLYCGCCQGNPCYWSSTGSEGGNDEEALDYLAGPSQCLLTSFSLLPYQAFWHPQCPVYSPYRVRLELHPPPPTVPLASPSSQSGPLYVSPSYDVQSIMREQSFVLPRPVWCSGNMIRVVLEGKATRQTLGMLGPGEAADHFYVCISHVSVQGHPLQVSSSRGVEWLSKIGSSLRLPREYEHSMASGVFTSPAPILVPPPPDHEEEDHLAIAHEYEGLWDEEEDEDEEEEEEEG